MAPAFQWLSPHLPLLPLLACVQLSGGYKYTWLSAPFQLSHSQPSAPQTHYCSLWLVLTETPARALCLALTGRDQVIKYDLSIDCTGVGAVDKSHVCERRCQVLSQSVNIIPNSFQSVHPRSPSAVPFFSL